MPPKDYKELWGDLYYAKPGDSYKLLEMRRDEEAEITMKANGQLTFIPAIDRVIFSGDATIVFWNDKTKTVVKRSPSEANDREKAVLTAFAIKALGVSGKHDLRQMMNKAFGSEMEKTYRWTDICKVRFYISSPRNFICLNPFMKAIRENFEHFEFLSCARLRDLVAQYDIFNDGHKTFEIPKHDRKYSGCRLVWTNPTDFGVAEEYDKERHEHYRHIYIRRSPEPMDYEGYL